MASRIVLRALGLMAAVLLLVGGEAPGPVTAAPAAASTLGPQRTAVILASAAGATAHPYATRQADLVNLIYSASNLASARSWYEYASYGQTTIVGGSGGVGTTADIVGPFTLGSASCSLSTIADDALKAADPSLDYNQYQRIIIAYNKPDGCSFAGVASFGQLPYGPFDGATQTLGVAVLLNQNLEDSTTPGRVGGTLLHEYGHTFMISHADYLDCGSNAISTSGCAVTAQGDPSDVMGAPSGYGQFNPIFKDRIGWLNGRVQTASASGTFTLNAYESASTDTKVLKVPRVRDASGQVTDYYYLDFRRPTDPWRPFVVGGAQAGNRIVPGGPAFDGGVLLHLTDTASTYGFGPQDSAILDAHPAHTPGQPFATDIDDAPLRPGDTFADPAANVTIGVTATTAATATVQVTLSGPCSPRPNVTVTPTPGGPGRLQVTVSATTSSGTPTNALSGLRFTATDNAVVDIPNGRSGASGSFTVPVPSGAAQVTFFVRRVTGGKATTAHFVVTDSCGEWPTLVGGGPTAF